MLGRKRQSLKGNRVLRALFRMSLCASVLLHTLGCRAISRIGESGQSLASRKLSRQGIQHIHEGNWSSAERLFSQALAISDDDDRAHRGIAEAYWNRGQKDAAIKHMQRAVELSANDPRLVGRLGEMYLDVGRETEAELQSLIAVENERESAEIWALRGDCLRRRQLPADALAAYHRALAIQPDSISVKLRVAELYLAGGQHDRVLATLDQLDSSGDESTIPSRVHLLRGIAMRNLQQNQQAKKHFAKAIQHADATAEPHLQLAAIALESNQIELAADHVVQASKLNPDLVPAGALFILPFALFSLPGGALADRYDKARIVQILKFLEIIVMILGAIALMSGMVWLMLAVSFLMGAQSAFFGPTKYSILPQHLPTGRLPQVNGFFQIATFVAILSGTVIAGLTQSIDDHGATLSSVFVVIVAVVGFIASRFIPAAPPAIRKSTAKPARDQLRVLLIEQRLSWVIVAIAWLWFSAATVMGLMPGIVRDVLKQEELGVTALMIALTVGVAVGCVVFVRDGLLRPRTANWIGATLLLTALLLFALVLGLVERGAIETGTFASMLACCVGLGVGAGMYIVPLITRLQRAPELGIRARVIAISNLANASFMIASSLLSLWLVMVMGYKSLFLALAVATFVVFFLILPRLRLE